MDSQFRCVGPGRDRRPFRSILTLLISALPVLGATLAPSAASAAAGSRFVRFAAVRQETAGYTPAEIEAAYNIAPLLTSGINGSGETIAFIELDRFAPSDLQQFDLANNLPAPTIQQFYVGGKPFHLPNRGETTMDLEWAHALAPQARIQIYYIPNQQVSAKGWKSVAQAVNMAVTNGATAMSISFGSCEASKGYKVLETALAHALAKGVSTFVASGDTGPFSGPISQCGGKVGLGYPAADPSVVAVGGTSLVLNPDNSVSLEVAWRLSGGGKGKPLPRPAWETAATLGAGRYRYGPDVSFDADPRTGVAIYFNGNWQTAGGTSLGAPAWAAIWTLMEQDARQPGKTLGGAPQLIWKIGNSSAYSQAFNSITSGGNGRYLAGPGWNPVTGWGTPNAAGLASALVQMAGPSG